MAEFLFEFAVEEILTKVISAATDEVTRIWRTKEDLELLRNTVKRIQSILRQTEDKQANAADVKNWRMELQDLIYSADDLLDDFSYETLRCEIEIGDQFKRKACGFVCCSYNPLSFRRQVANKVKKINETLADIQERVSSERALKGAVGGDAPNDKPDQMGTDSLLDKSEPTVGRKREVKDIISFIQANSSSPALTIVCIVGIGGLGKTTLAKLVNSEAENNNIFDERMWIDVSKISSASMIFNEMLQTLEETPGVYTNDDALLKRLRLKLEKKRFLLVLDNVWNENPTLWESLMKRLRKISESNGNSIIMTTRRSEVADVLGTTSRYILNLEQMKDEECWSIIKGKVFGKAEGSSIPEDLECIGLDIAKKCKGVPLVAEVLGGTLFKKDRVDWVSIRDSNVWQSVEPDNVLPILRLSFDHLDSPIKQCFAYCSLFPKNFVFEKQQLVQLWMAEGFLHQASENDGTTESSMEDTGDRYFYELWRNSFFQNVEMDRWGNIIGCKMHDLIHDLAMSISNKHQEDESSSYNFKTRDCRRMSIFVDDEERPSGEDYVRDELRKLRSLHSNRAVFHSWSDFESLRSLNLYRADYERLSDEVGLLKHLRYLDISENFRLQELPDSITKLYNLLTLRVNNCCRLKELPSKIGNLVSLRHFHFDDPKLMPFKVGSLTNLRTLSLFVVGEKKGYKIEELELLNELSGKLKIFNLEHVRNGYEAVAANLKGKKLSKLRLIWRRDTESDEEREGSLRRNDYTHKEVLEGLQPPGSIISLTIEGYMEKLFPEWMCVKVSGNGGSESPLNQLGKLKLLNCDKCEIMPTLGQLPRLKILQIEGMKKIRSIGSEFCGESKGNVKLFPALEKLEIQKMESLQEWESPDEQTSLAIPSLQELVISRCSLLESIPLSDLVSLKSMKIDSCHKLKYLPMGLTSLEDLLIRDCEELESISSSQDLVSLKRMWIENLPKLTILPKGLKSLEKFEVCHCRYLESISSLQDLASLKTMEILASCPKLESLPRGLTSLKRFRILGSSNLSADAFRGLSSLECLRMESMWNLELMPSAEDLTSLKTLWIEELSSVTSLPPGLHLLKCLQELEILLCHRITAISPELKSCTSLKRLSVLFCRGLISIETDIISSLTQLEELYLGPFSDELEEFPGFDEAPAVDHPCLKKLALNGNGKMKSLPYLGNLTALKELSISYFGISEFPIWASKLSSLEKLVISSCTSLIALPASIQQLSNLKTLDLHECPLLQGKFNLSTT